MKNWEAWSRVQYDKWASKLQPKYNNIKDWETPDWAKSIFGAIWDDVLDEKLKKKLYNLVMEICKDYDAEFAKELVVKIAAVVKKWINKI